MAKWMNVIFSNLQNNVKSKCPLMFVMLSTLILEWTEDTAKIHTPEMKMRKAMFILYLTQDPCILNVTLH